MKDSATVPGIAHLSNEITNYFRAHVSAVLYCLCVLSTYSVGSLCFYSAYLSQINLICLSVSHGTLNQSFYWQ